MDESQNFIIDYINNFQLSDLITFILAVIGGIFIGVQKELFVKPISDIFKKKKHPNFKFKVDDNSINIGMNNIKRISGRMKIFNPSPVSAYDCHITIIPDGKGEKRMSENIGSLTANKASIYTYDFQYNNLTENEILNAFNYVYDKVDKLDILIKYTGEDSKEYYCRKKGEKITYTNNKPKNFNYKGHAFITRIIARTK